MRPNTLSPRSSSSSFVGPSSQAVARLSRPEEGSILSRALSTTGVGDTLRLLHPSRCLNYAYTCLVEEKEKEIDVDEALAEVFAELAEQASEESNLRGENNNSSSLLGTSAAASDGATGDDGTKERLASERRRRIEARVQDMREAREAEREARQQLRLERRQRVSDQTLYSLLEINEDAEPYEIRKAYRKMALKHHPDKKGYVEEGEFIRIQQAYAQLSDEAKRDAYDQSLFEERSKIFANRVNNRFSEEAEDSDTEPRKIKIRLTRWRWPSEVLGYVADDLVSSLGINLSTPAAEAPINDFSQRIKESSTRRIIVKENGGVNLQETRSFDGAGDFL